METLKFVLLLLLLIPLIAFGQLKVKGQVINEDGEKVIASIYQFGSCLQCDFYGDFEINADSLGGFFSVYALGYKDQKINIQDTSYLTIELKEQKSHPRRTNNKEKRRNKISKKEKKRALRHFNGCCFASGTKILMADKTEKNIEILKAGDSILTFDFLQQRTIVSTILKMDKVLHDNLISITLENDFKIMNTDDHPYYVIGKGICSFKPNATLANYGIKANQLETDDQCYLYHNGNLIPVQILTIEKMVGTWITYNISVIDNNNNFFANGILVNNESKSNNLLP